MEEGQKALKSGAVYFWVWRLLSSRLLLGVIVTQNSSFLGHFHNFSHLFFNLHSYTETWENLFVHQHEKKEM